MTPFALAIEHAGIGTTATKHCIEMLLVAVEPEFFRFPQFFCTTRSPNGHYHL